MTTLPPANPPALYIGQMSGTSMDGVDSVLMAFSHGSMTLLASHHQAFAPQLKQTLLDLCQPCDNELHKMALASNALSELYTQGIHALLQQSNTDAKNITAIGCHGQTVRHMPPQYTTQLINGALLAERTQIDVVCDFRSRDMAAGGQGAPLVPAFHQALFPDCQDHTFVVNIGGMANISHLDQRNHVGGFDTGPGNVLMDAWVSLHKGEAFDKDGRWAASGQVNQSLLSELLDDPYFKMPAPKSTGREHFNLQWLKQFPIEDMAANDIQATLAQLTVETIAHEIEQLQDSGLVIICGGGALNIDLMQRLSNRLNAFKVQSSDALGHDPQAIEAMAFAWLAKQCIERKPANVPDVTGAKGERILGAIFPA